MEKELPTSFFDIQVHLLIHLVDEIELAGVVSARWMFWAERFMGVLKGYVRQKARPEGSMVEGWMLEECMYYVCEYLERTDLKLHAYGQMSLLLPCQTRYCLVRESLFDLRSKIIWIFLLSLSIIANACNHLLMSTRRNLQTNELADVKEEIETSNQRKSKMYLLSWIGYTPVCNGGIEIMRQSQGNRESL